jgi:hypothetical protein
MRMLVSSNAFIGVFAARARPTCAGAAVDTPARRRAASLATAERHARCASVALPYEERHSSPNRFGA